MTRGPVNRHDAGSARLFFSDIHEGLVLVQISQSWGDKESDRLHLILSESEADEPGVAMRCHPFNWISPYRA
jgi:hypothetical protein